MVDVGTSPTTKKNNYKKKSRSSYDYDDDNETYYINEFGDKVYKKRKTSYQKPRANNYTTRVTEEIIKSRTKERNNPITGIEKKTTNKT